MNSYPADTYFCFWLSHWNSQSQFNWHSWRKQCYVVIPELFKRRCKECTWQIMSASRLVVWEVPCPGRIVTLFTDSFGWKSARINCAVKTVAVRVTSHWLGLYFADFFALERWITSPPQHSLRFLCSPGGDHGSAGAEVFGSEQDRLLHHGGGGRPEAPDWPGGGVQANVSVHRCMFVFHMYAWV